MPVKTVGAAMGEIVGNLHADPAKTSNAVPRSRLTPSRPTPPLIPMNREEAVKLVTRLLAGYPNLGAHDPEGYIAALVQVMEAYPRWAAEQAIVKVDAENAQFPPSDKTLRRWLEDAIRPWKFQMEWEAQSRKQIAERPAEPEVLAVADGVTSYDYRGFDDAARRHGRPRGQFEPRQE